MARSSLPLQGLYASLVGSLRGPAAGHAKATLDFYYLAPFSNLHPTNCLDGGCVGLLVDGERKWEEATD